MPFTISITTNQSYEKFIIEDMNFNQEYFACMYTIYHRMVLHDNHHIMMEIKRTDEDEAMSDSETVTMSNVSTQLMTSPSRSPSPRWRNEC